MKFLLITQVKRVSTSITCIMELYYADNAYYRTREPVNNLNRANGVTINIQKIKRRTQPAPNSILPDFNITFINQHHRNRWISKASTLHNGISRKTSRTGYKLLVPLSENSLETEIRYYKPTTRLFALYSIVVRHRLCIAIGTISSIKKSQSLMNIKTVCMTVSTTLQT